MPSACVWRDEDHTVLLPVRERTAEGNVEDGPAPPYDPEGGRPPCTASLLGVTGPSGVA